MILNKQEILDRIRGPAPMIDQMIDEKLQLQPAGLDLTIKAIYIPITAGTLDFNNKNRELPDRHKVPLTGKFYYLKPGMYNIELNEIFNIPKNIIGKVSPRSSAMRCGASIDAGIWDPGYTGGGEILLIVHNPHGVHLYPNTKICQITFETCNETESYNGTYKKEICGEFIDTTKKPGLNDYLNVEITTDAKVNQDELDAQKQPPVEIKTSQPPEVQESWEFEQKLEETKNEVKPRRKSWEKRTR